MVLMGIMGAVCQNEVRFHLAFEVLEGLLDRLPVIRKKPICIVLYYNAAGTGLLKKASSAASCFVLPLANSTKHYPVKAGLWIIVEKLKNSSTRSNFYVVRMSTKA